MHPVNVSIMKHYKTISLVLAVLVSVLPLSAGEAGKPPIALGTPFTDNAILQCEMPVPVWGWSKPGETVTVEFAGQKKAATAGEGGKWMLELEPLKASADPAEMVVTEGSGAKRTLKNILVGEVWLASGQSNMQWLVSVADSMKIIMALKKKGEQPPIRECAVTDVFSSMHPIEHAAGEWKDGDYGKYSAIAFAFAHKLYQELGVPIGILNCSFSQTRIEAWTPRDGFAGGKDEYTRSIYQKVLESDPTTPEHKAAWNKLYQELEDTLGKNAELVKNGGKPEAIPYRTPGNLSNNRDASWLFNARLNPMIPYAIRGGIWNLGYANTGDGITYYDNLHSLVRGWRKCWNRPDLPVYFHQFYSPAPKGGWTDTYPSTGSTAEMRLGTWLARDIPNTGMASQIDVEGAVHYRNKTVPGQRLALHALKNQYGRAIVADGPMFKSYSVSGDKLTLEFDHAEGGLVVGETGSNAIGKADGATGFSNPKIIPNGEDQVKFFYLAGEDRVWHQADMKIDGSKIILTSPEVKAPRGVAYATDGVGFRSNVYNRELLPLTPFIYYDHNLVLSKDWPDDPIRISGVEYDPSAGGRLYEYRKMPLLSTQFRDNAVIQCDKPVTFWGSAIHDWGYEADGEAVIQFSFAGIEKKIPVTPGMREWQVTVPAMAASAEPKTLKVTFSIDGELVHERECRNLVVGEVWYVAAPSALPKMEVPEKSTAPVRMMNRRAKSAYSSWPHRFSVAVSTTPNNRFASSWQDADGFAAALGHRIGCKTGKPVGIILMTTPAVKPPKGKAPVDRKVGGPQLKEWMSVEGLALAPSLKNDYEQLAAIQPGNPFFDANVRSYIGEWKKLWSGYIPEMMKTKRVPDGSAWGSFPMMKSSITTKASQIYNTLVYSFTPGSFKGVVFLCDEGMFQSEGALYGEQLSALATSWKNLFGGEPQFIYTIPNKTLAPKITTPQNIKGESKGIEISGWLDKDAILKLMETVAAQP